MIENYGQIDERAPTLVADLAEIMAYFENREISRGDVEGMLFSKGGQGLLDELQLDALDSATANEKFQKLSEDVFLHLRYRKKSFASWYPFDLDGDVLVPQDKITPEQEVYIALTGFSRLKMFSNQDISKFAADFEILCYEAAQGFADGWDVLHMGVGGKHRAQFGTKLKKSLFSLGEKLGEDLVLAAIEELPENNLGNAGLDILIYKNLDDSAKGSPIYFAQCAAQQTGWPKKKFEASAMNFERYFSFFHKPGTIIFIPVSHRNLDGNWLNRDGHNAIVFDRHRIIALLRERIKKSNNNQNILASVPRPFKLGCAQKSTAAA